jgi:hypothetical protein
VGVYGTYTVTRKLSVSFVRFSCATSAVEHTWTFDGRNQVSVSVVVVETATMMLWVDGLMYETAQPLEQRLQTSQQTVDNDTDMRCSPVG